MLRRADTSLNSSALLDLESTLPDARLDERMVEGSMREWELSRLKMLGRPALGSLMVDSPLLGAGGGQGEIFGDGNPIISAVDDVSENNCLSGRLISEYTSAGDTELKVEARR